ncbi:hypothetical protein Tco_0291387 [Tanacetum coccineum]
MRTRGGREEEECVEDGGEEDERCSERSEHRRRGEKTREMWQMRRGRKVSKSALKMGACGTGGRDESEGVGVLNEVLNGRWRGCEEAERGKRKMEEGEEEGFGRRGVGKEGREDWGDGWDELCGMEGKWGKTEGEDGIRRMESP